MEHSSGELNERLVDHVLRKGADLGFTKYFWKKCEPLPRDIEHYSGFVKAVRDRASGLEPKGHSRQVGVGFGSIRSWSTLEVMPKLAHYLKALLEFGEPTRGRVWLTTSCTHGQAIPIGQFVQVPIVLKSWEDAESVLDQLKGTGEIAPPQMQMYMFGFFLGIMIGDAAK